MSGAKKRKLQKGKKTKKERKMSGWHKSPVMTQYHKFKKMDRCWTLLNAGLTCVGNMILLYCVICLSIGYMCLCFLATCFAYPTFVYMTTPEFAQQFERFVTYVDLHKWTGLKTILHVSSFVWLCVGMIWLLKLKWKHKYH